MNSVHFTHLVERFYKRCTDLFEVKNHDYTPQQAVLLDLFQTAFEEDISPEAVLRVHLQKHWTAIRGWTIGRQMKAEALDDRLCDAANYIAILELLSIPSVRDEIIAGIIAVKGSSCVCGCVAEASAVMVRGKRSVDQPCEHGALVLWLMTFATTLDSRPESWPMTRRALGSFLTDPRPIGATSPPDPSRSPTAMPQDTPPMSDMK